MVDLRLPTLQLLESPERPEPPTPTTPLLPAPKIAGLLPAVTGQAYTWVRVGPREYAVPGRIVRVFTSHWNGQLTLTIHGDHPYPEASGFRLSVPYSQAMWTRPVVDNREWRRAS